MTRLTASHTASHTAPAPFDDQLAAPAPTTSLARRYDNYVPALPAPTASASQMQPYAPTLPTMPAPVHATLMDDGSHAWERARAFTLRTSILGITFGLAGATLVGLALADRGAGAALAGALVTLFLAFAVVWLVAYWMEVHTSAGAIASRDSKERWRLVHSEARYRRQVDWQERNSRR